MNQLEALRVVMAAVGAGDLLVCCNGVIDRELSTKHDRPSNFTMIGSMGLGLSIGIGLALAQPTKRVFVLDGDGNVITGMNVLASAGSECPPNLIHVVLDSRSHASTGGQRALSGEVKLESVASAVGYRATHRADTADALEASLRAALDQPGPVMVLGVVDGGGDVPGDGRVTQTPRELAARFAAEARR